MDRMKRLASALLALCMLATVTPLSAFAQPVEESLPAAATQTADVSGSAPTEKPTAVPTEAAEAPVSTEETTGTPTPVSTDETTGTPTPVPADETTDTPTPVPTDEVTGTPTPVPTDAAEIKTIASFEAVAPEGFAVPQGTLETDLGLPVSLNAQFSDGAAGEVPVAWQCAAGYDPSAEAGTQFIFAAVLPEGYALAEGVSLPQILVTLTPPLANAMLMAEGIVERGEGWTLSDDGKLTVTGKVESSKIPSFASVESIEVAGYANFIINAPFTGNITVMPYGVFINQGNVSGDISVESGGGFANFGTISGGTFTGRVENTNTAPSPAAISPARR